MKILIFNWKDIKNIRSGGAELFLHEQAKIWVKKGHKVIWITSKDQLSPKEKIDGINFMRKGGRFGVYFWAPLISLKELKDTDVIIDVENGIPFFTPLFSKKKKILLIHHIHKDIWFKELKFPLSWIGYFLETKIMPLFYKKVPIVTISESSRKEIRKIMPKNKINIVYIGISKIYGLGKKAKKPEIVFLGRLKKYKSVDVLLKAVSLIDKNLTVNIIGRGDDESRLKSIARKLNLKGINFLGFVSENEKIKYLQRAWMAVNPSFVEGWSITNTEANSCGTPVIGSNVHGIRDSIINGKTGLLFKYGNEKELAEKILLLIKNERLRKKMSENAMKWAKKFSWEKSADKFLKILKKLK